MKNQCKVESEESLYHFPQPIIEVDDKGRVLFLNQEALQLLGVIPLQVLKGLSIGDFVNNELEQHSVLSDNILSGELGITTSDVLKRYYFCKTFMNNEGQAIIRLVLFHIQHMSNDLLNIYKLVVQQSGDSIMITNKEGKIQFVNRAFEKMTGYNKDEVIGRRPSLLKSGRHGNIFYQELWTCLIKGKSFRNVFTNKRKNGEIFYEEKIITPIVTPDGKITNFISSGRDVTKQRRIQKKIDAFNKLQTLQKRREQKIRSLSVIKGQEDERRRLSREIHDGLGQMLCAIRYKIDDLKEKKECSTLHRYLNDIQHMVNNTIIESKRISYALMPSILEDFGLFSAINLLAEDLNSNGGVEIITFFPSYKVRFGSLVEISLFRIVQESVNNAKKHAQATVIKVEFQLYQDSIVLKIIDNGIGYDVNKKQRGKGLYSMKERAQVVGADLYLLSKKDTGTAVVIELSKNKVSWKIEEK